MIDCKNGSVQALLVAQQCPWCARFLLEKPVDAIWPKHIIEYQSGQAMHADLFTEAGRHDLETPGSQWERAAVHGFAHAREQKIIHPDELTAENDDLGVDDIHHVRDRPTDDRGGAAIQLRRLRIPVSYQPDDVSHRRHVEAGVAEIAL